MRPGMLTWLVSLYFLIAAASSPRDQQQFRDQQQADETLPEMKAVPAVLRQEPTCDELRAMWRFSKRQSRAAENSNEIPTYRDPFSYNVWDEQATLRSVGGPRLRRPLVYGRLVHGVPGPRFLESTPERVQAFEEVARLFGTSVARSKAHGRRRPTSTRQVGGHGSSQNLPQTGSFQHLKELIQTERARELHEQKMLEENSVRDRYQGSPPGMIPYGQREQDDYFKAGAVRGRGQGDGVVFPDMLAPSNYEPAPPPSGYYRIANYMPRPYPEPMIVAERSTLASARKPKAQHPVRFKPNPLSGQIRDLYLRLSPAAGIVYPKRPYRLGPTYLPHSNINDGSRENNQKLIAVLKNYQTVLNQLLFNGLFSGTRTNIPTSPDLSDFSKQKFLLNNDYQGGYDMKSRTENDLQMDKSYDTHDLNILGSIVPKKGNLKIKKSNGNKSSIVVDFLRSNFYPQILPPIEIKQSESPSDEKEYENSLTHDQSVNSINLDKNNGVHLLIGNNKKDESNIAPFERKVHEPQRNGNNDLVPRWNELRNHKVGNPQSSLEDNHYNQQINMNYTPKDIKKILKRLNLWKYFIDGEIMDENYHFDNKLDMQLFKMNNIPPNIIGSSSSSEMERPYPSTDIDNNVERYIGK